MSGVKNKTLPPPDQRQRDQALSADGSYIVQAPAGSGKTTLLVQRYLQLLAVVRRPEEILAITFTRAAAMEMKQRVLAELQQDTPLTQAIRQQDSAHGWMLNRNPNLLKIQTIDSFATELATQIPGDQSAEGMSIDDKPEHFYLQAGRNVLSKLFTSDPSSFYVSQFLTALDNNADTADRLLTAMLAKRDQWLDVARRITSLALSGDEEIPTTLNRAIEDLQEALLKPLQRRLSDDDHQMVQHIAEVIDQDSDILALLPLMFTQAGSLRKAIDRRQGEAFADKEFKGEFLSWLASLRERDLEPLLFACSQLPGLQEDPDAFDTLIATGVTLALAAAELESLLQQRRSLDFTGMLMRASAGLEDEQGPTDLALYWDYRISHLLVDEFQDTSRSQFQFFNLLTAGWTPGDGNTFFAVGDPMQSVYRFRDADVSIFAHCWQHGLPNVPLEPLQLSANFRSSPELVAWNNALFSQLFPAEGLPHLGAIPFSPAQAQQSQTSDRGEQSTPILQHAFVDEHAEAQAIAAHIKGLLARIRDDSDEKIGVLCRARTHLPLLLQTFKAEGIDFTSTDIDSLAAEPIVTDLLTLHRLLLRPSDRLAWFSLLRSPMIGLTLKQLEHLVPEDDLLEACVRLQPQEPRLQRLVSAIEWARHRLFELPPCEVVEGCWMRLGGVDAYPEAALIHAQAWFDLLESVRDQAWDPTHVAEKTADLYAQDHSHARVQVMTIHKSKGLEFTHVILPNLGRRGRPDEANLLLWRPTPNGLLVGIRQDPVHQWLRFEEKSRSENEVKRLLYVACTRAEQSLWLSTASQRPKPAGLAQYLPDLAVPKTEEPVPESDETDKPTVPEAYQGLLRRLPGDYRWSAESALLDEGSSPAAVGLDGALAVEGAIHPITSATEHEDDRSNRFNLSLGNLVHLSLAHIGEQHRQSREVDMEHLRSRMQSWLPKLDAPTQQWTQVLDAALEHIRLTLADANGQWLLQAHPGGHFEWPVTIATTTGPRRLIFDRIFQGPDAWWIVDFKTSQPQEHESLEDFLNEERQRYRPQLNQYHRALSALLQQHPNPLSHEASSPLAIRTGLYFTGLARLEELTH